MDNKHFIWIVPLIFILGFIVGYVSGLNIPKDITFGVELKTLEALALISNNTLELGKIQQNCSYIEKSDLYCHYSACYQGLEGEVILNNNCYICEVKNDY